MPGLQTYRTRQARELCPACGETYAPPGHYCSSCLWKQRQKARVRADDRRLAPGPNLLLCCNQWHPITQTPLTVPCCGRRYFEEIPV